MLLLNNRFNFFAEDLYSSLSCHFSNGSKFISLLSKNNIEINRKSLAYMAVNDADGFSKLVDSINKS